MTTSDTPETDAVIRTAMESPTCTESILAAKVSLKCMELERERDRWMAEFQRLTADAINLELPEDE